MSFDHLFDPPSDVEAECLACEDGRAIADCENCEGAGMVQQRINMTGIWTGPHEPDAYPEACDQCEGTGRPECPTCCGSRLVYLSPSEADHRAKEYLE